MSKSVIIQAEVRKVTKVPVHVLEFINYTTGEVERMYYGNTDIHKMTVCDLESNQLIEGLPCAGLEITFPARVRITIEVIS